MGAGVIPMAVHSGQLQFLLQKTFTGRKTGFLLDFGGGLGEAEDYRATAVREFVEESETLYLSDDIKTASRTEPLVKKQMTQVEALFEQTLYHHPHWWCQRDPGSKAKDWRTYFIEFPFRDVTAINQEWASDITGRFKKRRELLWIPADRLLQMYAKSPQRLWKRVRQLQGATALIREIQTTLQTIH